MLQGPYLYETLYTISKMYGREINMGYEVWVMSYHITAY